MITPNAVPMPGRAKISIFAVVGKDVAGVGVDRLGDSGSESARTTKLLSSMREAYAPLWCRFKQPS